MTSFKPLYCFDTSQRPIFIGHRGVAAFEPENTLISFKRAQELGAPWVELDVYNIEGNLIVFHDDTLDRTTNGSGLITTTTINSIRVLDAGKGELVPFLSEVVELLAGQVGINIELKGQQTALLTGEYLRSLPEHLRNPSKILVSSFDHSELDIFNAYYPDFFIAPLFDYAPSITEIAPYRERAAAVHINYQVATPGLCKRLHDLGLYVSVYTVNEQKSARALSLMGVDGLFSDTLGLG